MIDIFFQLLQIAVGKRDLLDCTPTPMQWKGLFETAKQQALFGICADAIEKLPENQRPPKDIAVQWAFMTMKIEQRNKYLNDRIVPICEKLRKDGFDVCLLKGQGVAEYYPKPMLRQSGDFDIWIIPKGFVGTGKRIDFRKSRDRIVEYAYRNSECNELGIHHIDFPVLKNIAIELHFIPAYFNNYITHRIFLRWLNKEASCQFEHITSLGVACPTDTFNLVFLSAHIYKHFLYDGIGMRQIMDYYYVVEKWAANGKLLDVTAMDELCHVLKLLKMTRFCGAMMWVFQRVLGMERSHMLIEPDMVYGRLLLEKILSGGNFGQYSTDILFQYKSGDGHFMRYYKRVRNSMCMLRYAPMEVIWTPVRIAEIFFKIRLDRLKYRRNA